MQKWFTFNLLMTQGQYLNLMWIYLIYFSAGEMIFYTIERLMNLPTIVRWYDLVWLLFIMFMFGLNSHKLFLILVSDIK